jgi:CHAD domain-containing protein
MRDAQVMLETLDLLRPASADQLDDNHFEAFRQYLLDHLQACEGEFFEEANLLESVADELRHGRRRIDRLDLGKPKFASIRPGLQQIYQKGQQAFWLAKEVPTDEHLHEWRKQVKYLWHHIELLHLAWAPVLDATGAELHRLADLLGADHDLSVLETFLREDGLEEGLVFTAEWEGVFIAERAVLREELFPLGKKIYQEKPKRFARRIETYYKAWNRGPLPRVADQAGVLDS